VCIKRRSQYLTIFELTQLSRREIPGTADNGYSEKAVWDTEKVIDRGFNSADCRSVCLCPCFGSFIRDPNDSFVSSPFSTFVFLGTSSGLGRATWADVWTFSQQSFMSDFSH
jgi:hypothetical protein